MATTTTTKPSSTPSTPNVKLQRHSRIGLLRIDTLRRSPAGLTQRRFDKAQAERYAAALDLDALGRPVINIRDGIPWIVDGQHRIEALKIVGFGEDKIECEIFEDLTDREQAALFLHIDQRRAINQFEKFLVACTAEYPAELGIRRAVESQGLKVSRERATGCVAAVTALRRVYEKGDETVLGRVLRTIRDGYAGDPTAFDGQVIEGIGLIFSRYNGQVSEREMAAALGGAQYGARGLIRRAEATRDRTGNPKVQCIAAAAVDLYNKGRHTKRLPPWWKTATAANGNGNGHK